MKKLILVFVLALMLSALLTGCQAFDLISTKTFSSIFEYNCDALVCDDITHAHLFCGEDNCRKTSSHTHNSCNQAGCTIEGQHIHNNCNQAGCAIEGQHAHNSCNQAGCNKTTTHSHNGHRGGNHH